MEKLVGTLGIDRLSKSQVSEMAKDLDSQVAAFRTRPLDAGPYTVLAADALVLKVREGGRTVNLHAMVATGVNAEGYGERLNFRSWFPDCFTKINLLLVSAWEELVVKVRQQKSAAPRSA
jgi:putative transposase